MTRKILLITNDSDFKTYVHTSALTLTKLNHQIDFTDNKSDNNINLIIIDFDNNDEERIEDVSFFRNSDSNSNTKILAVGSDISGNLKKRIFSAGCDSVMNKSEFKTASDNILVF